MGKTAPVNIEELRVCQIWRENGKRDKRRSQKAEGQIDATTTNETIACQVSTTRT